MDQGKIVCFSISIDFDCFARLKKECREISSQTQDDKTILVLSMNIEIALEEKFKAVSELSELKKLLEIDHCFDIAKKESDREKLIRIKSLQEIDDPIQIKDEPDSKNFECIISIIIVDVITNGTLTPIMVPNESVKLHHEFQEFLINFKSNKKYVSTDMTNLSEFDEEDVSKSVTKISHVYNTDIGSDVHTSMVRDSAKLKNIFRTKSKA